MHISHTPSGVHKHWHGAVAHNVQDTGRQELEGGVGPCGSSFCEADGVAVSMKQLVLRAHSACIGWCHMHGYSSVHAYGKELGMQCARTGWFWGSTANAHGLMLGVQCICMTRNWEYSVHVWALHVLIHRNEHTLTFDPMLLPWQLQRQQVHGLILGCPHQSFFIRGR